MKKPNLYILGAPKCGTTALATWLSTHPDIFVSPTKEPHYFSEEYRLTKTLEQYEALFSDADESVAWACEASVWHLFSETAVPNILDYCPDAYFVVMERNPIDMTVSMYQQQQFNGNELITDLEGALALNDERYQGHYAGVRRDYAGVKHTAYYKSCALGWQLSRLYERVPEHRIHVIVFDDLIADPERVYSGLLDFLQLSKVLPEAFNKVNTAKRRKYPLLDSLVLGLVRLKARFGIRFRLGFLAWLRRNNVQKHKSPVLEAQLHQKMSNVFRDDVHTVAKLLGRDLSTWLERNDG